MRKYNVIITGIVLMAVLVTMQPFNVEARQKIVLFDEGHGQRFSAERNSAFDLSELSALFQNEGLLIKTNKGKT